jgi:hypothetical protein
VWDHFKVHDCEEDGEKDGDGVVMRKRTRPRLAAAWVLWLLLLLVLAMTMRLMRMLR